MPASSHHSARQHRRCTLQRQLLISLTVAGFYSAVSQYAIISKSNNFLQDSKYIDSLHEYVYAFTHGFAEKKKKWKPIDARVWRPYITSEHPYNNMTPKLDVVWTRGYYSAGLPHSERPIEYYNARGMSSKALPPTTFKKYFTPDQCGTFWIRMWDLSEWVNTILPTARCGSRNITIITSDEDWDVPHAVPRGIPEKMFQSEQIKAWYSTNVVVKDQPRLFPVPIGIPIHYGFPGSPDSADTIRTMNRLRLDAKPYAERSQSILYDVGTLGGGARRDQGRKAAKAALSKCPEGRIRIKPKGGPLETWPLYASHQFAIARVGAGYDTYRVWEYLFFGTVPIVLSSPLDSMYSDAHVPIIIVKDWNEVCSWTEDDMGNLFQRFHKWIANSHMWLRPSLWVPRDQTQMDKLCDASPGCRSGGQFYNAKKVDDKKSTAIRNAYQNESKVEGDRRALVKMLGMGGRLGDQMFMYASTLAFANKYNLTPCIENYLEPRKDMATMFVGPFEFCENRDHDINWNWEGHCEDEPSKRMPLFSTGGAEGKSVGLWGYMHFAEYFLEIKAKVFETFALLPELQIKAEERLKRYGDAMLVGVHVRRGDRSSIASRWDVTYYERALKYMRKKYTC